MPKTLTKGKTPSLLDRIRPIDYSELDVRPLLRRGVEPFESIVRALADLPETGVLRVLGSFPKVPLFSFMRMHGWQPWAECEPGGDCIVWFYRSRLTATCQTATCQTAT